MPFESWSVYAAVSTVVLLAGVIKGFAGFGLAMVAGPLLAVLLSPVEAVVAVLVLEVLTGAQLLRRALAHTDWAIVVPLTIASALTMPLGAYALVSLDGEVMRRTIAIAALAFAVVLIGGWRYRGGQALWISGVIGGVSGAITGATGMGNPVLVLYVLASGIAERNRASLVTMVTMMIVLAIASLGATGGITIDALSQSAYLLPFAIIGTFAGARLFRRTGESTYRRGALGIIVVAALAALVY
jgi:uncharacterized membrane protein YfcA